MKVKVLKNFLEEFDENYEVYFVTEGNDSKSYRITKIGIVEEIECLVLGSGECPNCKGEN